MKNEAAIRNYNATLEDFGGERFAKKGFARKKQQDNV